MSSYSVDQFNVWFPALVCGLVIGLIAAASWDFLRRRFWCCASRFWPGILREVGLDNLSRVEVEEKMRLVSDMLSAVHTEVTKPQVTPILPMAKAIDPIAAESSNSSNFCMSSNNDYDLEGQEPLIRPFPASTGRPITFTATAYFADGTPTFVIHPVKKFFKRHGNGTLKRWKSSIVLQASLPIEAYVVAEFEELARISILKDNQCTFQLGNWAILYYKAGKVCLHELKEGDVPVNVEARWQDEKTGIEMRGLYLNGAQVKVATEHTSTILRSVGPATKGHRDFDELNFNIEDLDVPREDAIIFAAKLIDGDGISLIVRSEATFIRPERAKSTFTEAFWSRLQWIFQSAKMMTKLLLKTEDRQPETALTLPDFLRDQEQSALIVEHWKGVLEIETLEKRKEVLDHIRQQIRVIEIPIVTVSNSYFRDRHCSERYWQRVLQEWNVILQPKGCSQCGTHIRLRGGIRFLLGNYEDALHDLDRAHLVMQDDHWTTLYERALVKCMLARYSEALEDVCSVISINPNFSDIQELKTCIQHILDQRPPFRLLQDDVSSLQAQPLRIVEIPDLLTGDGGGDCSRVVPIGWSSEGLATHANSKDAVVYVTLAMLGARGWPMDPFEPDRDLPQAVSGSVPGRTESPTSNWSGCASARDELQLWQEVVNEVGRQTTSSDYIKLTDDRMSESIIGNRSFKSYAGFMQGILQSEIQKNLDQGRRAPFPLPVTVDIMTHIADCMSQLHDHHEIAHRGLKPANVRVSRPGNIVELEALMSLNLRECGVLGEIPDSKGKLKNLKALTFLDLSGCKFFHDLPEGIGKLKALTSLNLTWCGDLEKLPESMGKLQPLTSLPDPPCPPFYLHVKQDVKLVDFGLSTAESQAPESLEPAIGTTLHRAPEAFSHDGRVLKRWPTQCDVWSYGLLFSDTLHGKVYSQANPSTRLNEALLSNARPKLPPSLPEELASIIRDCWAEDPRERPLFVDICRRLRSVQKCLSFGLCYELNPPVSTYAQGEFSGSACSESAGSESADSSFVSEIESHVRNDSEQVAEVDVSKLITDLSSWKTEVHRDAAYQIRCLTKMNSENRHTIAEQGGIPFLINLLRSPDKMTQEHAVTALFNLSLLESNRALIMRAGAIYGIVYVVKWGQSMEARENAAATIQCLSYENENKISIGNAGAIPALVELLQNGTLQGKKDAANALCNLAGFFASPLAIRNKFVEIGNTEPATMLINFITCGSSKGQELATALLCRLCLDDHCFIEAAYQCGATDPLEAVLRSEAPTLRCKRKAQHRLSDGAQLRQEVVNDRREVLEFVNDRRDVLNPIIQCQEMKRLRMTKMGLVGSPRASGSYSALQKSTLASNEPQAQPRFDRV